MLDFLIKSCEKTTGTPCNGKRKKKQRNITNISAGAKRLGVNAGIAW